MVYIHPETRRKNSRWRAKIRAILYADQNAKCYWCGKKLLLYPQTPSQKLNHGSKQMEIDHILPVTIGGSNHISNLVGSCRQCNLQRAHWLEKSRHRFIILGSSLSYHQPRARKEI